MAKSVSGPNSLRVALRSLVVAGFALALFQETAASQEPPVDLRAELQSLRDQVDAQRRLIEQQAAVIDGQQHQLDSLQRFVTGRAAAAADSAVEVNPAAREIVAEPTESARHVEDSASAVPRDSRLPPFLDPSPFAEPASSSDGVRVGYADGFFIASHENAKLDAAEFPFLMRVNSRMQLRYSAFDSDGPNRDENNLEFERLRLLFSGYAFTPDLTYQFQLDGDSDDHEQFELLDYFLTYDIGHAACACERGRFGLKAGLYRLPFSRARQDSAWVLQFNDRTIASQFFDINRSIAIGLFGSSEAAGRRVNWEAALSNGFAAAGSAPGRVGELDRNFGYSARVSTELMGQWGTDGEPDLSFHQCPAIKIGGGFAFTRLDRTDGPDEFSSIPAFSDSGMNQDFADVLPSAVDEFNMFLYSVDANLKYRGLSLHSEYYFRHLTDFAGAHVDDRFDHGFLLQTGYFVCPERLELLARWSHMVGDSGSLADTFHSSDELAVGVAWYLRGHNLKLVFDATHVNGSPLDKDTINIRGGDSGWLVRTQFQTIF